MHFLNEELLQFLVIFLSPSWLHDLIRDVMKILGPNSFHICPKSLYWIQRAWVYWEIHLFEVWVIDLVKLLAIMNRMIVKNYQHFHALTLALQSFHEVHENISVIVVLKNFMVYEPSLHADCTNDMDRWSLAFDHVQLHSRLQPASSSLVPHMQTRFINV